MSRTPAAGSLKECAFAVFDLTPHKVSICHLIQLFAPPSQHLVPFPFESISQHNRFGLFIFSLTRACNDFVEPPLTDLINQLKAVEDSDNGWTCEHLMSNLSELSSPDDLFNFFDKLRAVITAPDIVHLEDDQIYLDPNSHLGLFLRCCMLSFSLLTFEGVCHLLANISTYCTSTGPSYEQQDAFNVPGFHHSLKGAEMFDEIDAFQRNRHTIQTGESSKSHTRSPILITHPTNDAQLATDSWLKDVEDDAQSSEFLSSGIDDMRSDDHQGFLRTRWQVEGYLNMQADLLEKEAGYFPMNSFSVVLKQLQKLAPELHRVGYLEYLNSLFHSDYLSALENLHSYFDVSAGNEGAFYRSSTPPSDIYIGRYETALLCLGTMHCYFGHSKKALEALTEAVRFSQLSSDDACLAYILAAICNLLSDIGISNTAGILGSQDSLETSMTLGAPLTTQQQLLVLLNRSMKRADSMKLKSLMAFDRLILSKFDLRYVRRSLVCFGPKSSTNLRTCPVTVCKDLRLCSQILSEFGNDGLSQPNDDGAFSTSWIQNLATASNCSSKKMRTLRSLSANDFDLFHFDAQPNPIPGSVLQLAGSSYLQRATSWELYGSAPLVQLNALVYASCFANSSSSMDLSLSFVKLVQHLAIFKGYKEAFTALKLAESKFSSLTKSHIQLCKLQLLHERALHRGQLKIAGRMCDEIGMLASSTSGVDMDLKTEENLRHSRTLLAACQYDKAAAVAHTLFCMCYKFSMQVESATVLLLLAEIHKKSGNIVLALQYVLGSMSFCRTFNLDLLEASATLTLVELWLSLGSSFARRGLNLLRRVIPMILGHGGLALRARAWITLAKCYLSNPAFLITGSPDIVLDPLNQAAEELQILEYHEMAAEAFYLIAIIYNHLGQLEAREEAASLFKKHITAVHNPQVEEDPSSYEV